MEDEKLPTIVVARAGSLSCEVIHLLSEEVDIGIIFPDEGKKDIVNVATIGHVDCGKTSLSKAIESHLAMENWFSEYEDTSECQGHDNIKKVGKHHYPWYAQVGGKHK